MSVESPVRLVALLVPVALAAWYVWSRSRRTRQIVVFSSLDLAERVAPSRSGWRRWATATAGLAGVLVLAVAFARPVIAIPVPQEQASLILAIDVSLSMGAADVEPSRIDAAREAAGRFAEIAPDDLCEIAVTDAGHDFHWYKFSIPVNNPDSSG